MTDQQRVENVLQGLRALQKPSLSVIRLSEPIHGAAVSQRTSDVSVTSQDNPSPASLEADLTHYKELFSKLRFSYIEQVTKEKFLRAIVGDPPQIVGPAENSELEEQLVEIKAVLKQQKQNVADIVAELEAQGRDLSRRYETVSLQTELLATLPAQIQGMQATLDELRESNKSKDEEMSDDPELNLPLEATQELVEERKEELEEMDRQIRTLQQAVPRQTSILEREQRELKVLEQERDRAIRTANDALDRKRDGGGADELELRGRWLRAIEAGTKGLLGIEAH